MLHSDFNMIPVEYEFHTHSSGVFFVFSQYKWFSQVRPTSVFNMINIPEQVGDSIFLVIFTLLSFIFIYYFPEILYNYNTKSTAKRVNTFKSYLKTQGVDPDDQTIDPIVRTLIEQYISNIIRNRNYNYNSQNFAAPGARLNRFGQAIIVSRALSAGLPQLNSMRMDIRD